MSHIKPRLLALGMLALSITLTYYNWQDLLITHKYSTRLAAFAPLCAVGGLFLVAFPEMAGKPNTTKEKTLATVVFITGLIAGLVNWYLMDPGFFRH